MALNKEDKADVSRAMGKAMANKVAKVTRDKGKEKLVSRGYANAQAALTSYKNKWKRENSEEYAVGQSVARNRYKKYKHRGKQEPFQVSKEYHQGKHQMVGFYKEENKIRFKINLGAADRAGLKISSKLLELAKIVEW